MKELAIVGTHTRTRDEAPWNDADVEIWVFNEAAQAGWCKRWDAVFQLHKRQVYESPKNFVRGDHFEWLQKEHGAGKVIWMQEMDKRVPDCKRYPLEAILMNVPGAHLRWFQSTPAYALALALFLGYKHIDLYGMDMSSNTEYGYQLPNFQFWVGVALGMGVVMNVLSNEQYFGGALYGYEGEIQLARVYFAGRAVEIKGALKDAEWEVHKTRGRLEAALAGNAFDKVAGLVIELQTMTMQLGEALGSLEEAERYGGRDDPIPRQEFERKTAEGQRDGEQARENMWHAGGKAEYVWNVWKQTKNPQAMVQLQKFMGEQMGFAKDTGRMLGKHRENRRYIEALDERITAAGGMRTVLGGGV
jgi:hypothetical protein